MYRDVKISDFMSTWLTKTGYPVVDVVKLNNRKYRLSQSRFVNKPNFEDQKILKKRWPVRWFKQSSFHPLKMTSNSKTAIVKQL